MQTEGRVLYRQRGDCRACGSADLEPFLDLGATPLANRFLAESELGDPEYVFPLVVSRCASCGLAQLRDVIDASVLFSDYLYFSSASAPVVAHFQQVADELLERYVRPDDLVCEIGSNDGVFLRHLVGKARVLGIEPAQNIAAIAQANGVPTLARFFDLDSAREILAEHGPARLIFAANVLAHIDSIDSVVAAAAELLAPQGVLVFEVARLQDMLLERHFDQVYHEHLCYWSLAPVESMLARIGLRVIDVQIVPMQGQSYQIHAVHEDSAHLARPSVAAIRAEEYAAGVHDPETYRAFAARVEASARRLRELLDGLRAEGKRIVGYGAPAKATTLLGYAGIDGTHLEYISDSTAAKQGRFMPGSHIPIRAPETLLEDPPDYILVLAWNYAGEIFERERALREAGVRFIVPLPEPHLLG